MISEEELNKRFRHHAPKSDEVGRKHDGVRACLRQAAGDVLKLIGCESREASVFLTKMEEAMFWANAAIARNQ